MMIDTDLLLSLGATYKKLLAGEIIFREGTYAQFYHQVIAGRVCWCNLNHDGREVLQELVGPGESFGELPLFDGQPYACTAVAQTDCVVIRLGFASFKALLQDRFDIHMAFSRLMSERLRFRFFLQRELASNSPEHAIGELLKYFFSHQTNICKNSSKLLLTRQQIANLTNMRVETVIRAIKSLESKGNLSIVKGKIFLGSALRGAII